MTDEFPNLVVYDFAALSFLVARHARLAAEFDDIIQKTIFSPETLLRNIEQKASCDR